MFHTIVSLDDVFMQSNNICDERLEATINGVILQGTKTKDGMKIERIISTNPQDYLSNIYCLGNTIK